MDRNIKRLEREISRLKERTWLGRVLRTSLLALLLSAYGYFFFSRTLPLIIRGVLEAM